MSGSQFMSPAVPGFPSWSPSMMAVLGRIQKTRTYARFSDVAADVVEARIYLGIHFRFADTVARRQGKQAADWAFSHILRPID